MNTVKNGVFTGAAAFGFLKALNGNRKTNKALRRKRKGKSLTPEQERLVAENTIVLTTPSGEKIEHTPPLIQARTSTKLAIGGFGALLPIIQGIQEIDFPWPWVESFTNSDLFVQIATLAGAYLIARYSKSPLTKQAL